MTHKPETWNFEQTAASALALLCANLSLARSGVKAGQRLLVDDGGEVGSTTILLARAGRTGRYHRKPQR